MTWRPTFEFIGEHLYRDTERLCTCRGEMPETDATIRLIEFNIEKMSAVELASEMGWTVNRLKAFAAANGIDLTLKREAEPVGA